MVRRLFAVLLAIVILLILVGFLLPRTIVVERSRLIEQPPEVIFAVLSDFRHFPHWSPWFRRAPDAGYRYEGPDSGVGATLVWSDEAGSGGGRWSIIAVDPPRRIDLALELGETEVQGYFLLEQEQTGQLVTWGMRLEVGSLDLVGRYMGLILPGLVGREYRDGLEMLDVYLAQTPGQVPPLNAEDGSG